MFLTFRSSVLIATVREAWPVGLALGGIAGAGALGWVLAATSPAAVRYAGTALEVLGIATVAVGLSEVRKSFGRPSFPLKVLVFFRQIAAVFGAPKAYGVRAEAGGLAITGGKARLIHRAGPGASLESRVAILEEGLDRLREEVDTLESETKKALAAVNEALTREQRERETESRRLAKQLEDFAVGGLHLELVGLTWLLLGALGANLPDEVAKLLSAAVMFGRGL